MSPGSTVAARPGPCWRGCKVKQLTVKGAKCPSPSQSGQLPPPSGRARALQPRLRSCSAGEAGALGREAG